MWFFKNIFKLELLFPKNCLVKLIICLCIKSPLSKSWLDQNIKTITLHKYYQIIFYLFLLFQIIFQIFPNYFRTGHSSFLVHVWKLGIISNLNLYQSRSQLMISRHFSLYFLITGNSKHLFKYVGMLICIFVSFQIF